MKKWIVYVLGLITGVTLTFILAFFVNLFRNSENRGLEMFETPGEYIEYSRFEVIQVIDSGRALAHAENIAGPIVLLIPNENQRFYDDQKIVLKKEQRAQNVGTFRYGYRRGQKRTVPAIRVVDEVELPEELVEKDLGMTFFDKPGKCVSRKDFEVQQVLESGDAIAREINNNISGYVFTSDLEVLILAEEGRNFYNNQIVKAPKGKCARQIGNYKHGYKTIPIVAFK